MRKKIRGKKKKGRGISVKEPKTAERQEEGQKNPEKQNMILEPKIMRGEEIYVNYHNHLNPLSNRIWLIFFFF